MIHTYFVILIRSFWRNKLYILLNIVGLSIGIASIVWGFQDYRYCTSYNNFHKNGAKIFRVLTKAAGSDHPKGICPGALAKFAKNDFADVTQTVRWEGRGLSVLAAQSDPFASFVNFTDAAFFEIFNFPLLSGTNILEDASTILITETVAKRFYGNQNAVGKTITLYSDQTYRKPLTITGILKDPPANSSIQFEFITSTKNLLKDNGTVVKDDDWGWFSTAVFVSLSDSRNEQKINRQLNKYLPLEQAARQDLRLTSFFLEPLKKIDRVKGIENNGLIGRPTDAATYGPLIISILILLSASLNFANTTVAKSSKRLKEIGVRKVLGGSFVQIMVQQLLECSMIAFIAVLLSIAINALWFPAYNAMFNHVDIKAHYFGDQMLIEFIVGTAGMVILVAGSYPAFYLSKFNTADIFKGLVRFGGRNMFSRALLGLQISVSVISVIGSLAFARNSQFQRQYDYGYEMNNIVGVNFSKQVGYNAFRDELRKIPGIKMMAGTVNNIGFSYQRLPLEAKGEKTEAIYLKTGEDYQNVMRLKLVAGRSFYSIKKTDKYSLLINEKLAFQFGWKLNEAIGQKIRMNDSSEYEVIGILKDFTQGSLFDPIQPLAMGLAEDSEYAQLVVRSKPGDLSDIYAQTKAAWEKVFPMKPFMGYYQSEIGSEALRVNESVAVIFAWFGIITVLIASTGLFALVSLSVFKKMKEIAVRNVLGANGWDIFRLVAKGYVFIFMISTLIGCFIGYSFSKGWTRYLKLTQA